MEFIKYKKQSYVVSVTLPDGEELSPSMLERIICGELEKRALHRFENTIYDADVVYLEQYEEEKTEYEDYQKVLKKLNEIRRK